MFYVRNYDAEVNFAEVRVDCTYTSPIYSVRVGFTISSMVALDHANYLILTHPG